MPIRPDGTFDLELPDQTGLVLTVVGVDGRVLRQPITAGSGQLDLRGVELPVAEFPPGISGQGWDRAEDRPVHGGLATLRRGNAVIATVRLDADGKFAIELTPERLLTAGSYRLRVDAPGYRPATATLALTDDVTSYRLGRIELAPGKPA